MKTVADVIIEARRRALKEVTIASNTKHYNIRKDFTAGKLIIKPKERAMTTLLSTKYLEYDTRTV